MLPSTGRLPLSTVAKVCAPTSILRCSRLAANGRRTIPATLESITVKDGIKAALTMSKFEERRHELIDCQGARVLIVVADPEEYEGERKPAPITPDQPEMPLGDTSPMNEAPI
jgi:hypothetical protein